eukprot:gene3060-3523_t
MKLQNLLSVLLLFSCLAILQIQARPDDSSRRSRRSSRSSRRSSSSRRRSSSSRRRSGNSSNSNKSKSCNSAGYPEWPKDFKIKYVRDSDVTTARELRDYQCTSLAQFSTEAFIPSFKKPYFCIKKKNGREIPEMQFTYNSTMPGKRCVQIKEPSDSFWKQPYLCVPEKSWYQFTWYYQNNIHGKTKQRCMRWKKGKSEWCNNYLCAQEKSKGIDECATKPCRNNGTCVDGINSFTCRCRAGYTGKHCQTEINECLSSPCRNHGYCIDFVNQYRCICPAGYNGTHCEKECADGYFGFDCKSVCRCHGNQDCHGVTGSCTCKPGYIGNTCNMQCLSGRYGLGCQSTCQCRNGAHCDHVTGKCTCRVGFTGTYCQTVVLPPEPTEAPEP